MTYDVIVVGGGIGGLTTAALLAARGLSVCVLERQSEPGGCAASFEKFGHQFESGLGLYALWGKDEIHERIFAELPVIAPQVQKLNPAYVVRLPDQTDIVVSADPAIFTDSLKLSFPECVAAASAFYREAESIGSSLLRAINRIPDLRTAGKPRQLRALWPNLANAARWKSLLQDTTARHLAGTSERFRFFVDAQLQMFAQCSSVECAYLYACVALTASSKGLYAMAGGGAALATALTESVVQSGGTVRLNTPVLRLAYDRQGKPIGVTLLSGETVTAARAIVSNLTVWDTYGKLVGLERTPHELRKRLKTLSGHGAYLIYASVQERLVTQLAADHFTIVSDYQSDAQSDSTTAQINFAMAPKWNPRAPAGHRAATIHVVTTAEDWFAFHEDESEQEAQDQQQLEIVWQRLHAALPELGDGIEVIDTATPQTFYAGTRRKLGMVGGLGQSLEVFGPNSLSHRTPFPNLFMVGDTTFPGAGLAAVSYGALIVANEILPSH